MARPTGRYFASVIAKIRDAKKKEMIVIDESFKMQLRQQVMLKIAAQAAPVRTSWFERLAPFKSYLAVVPALGLVIVAVVGISKLPIDFGSKVVVPTSLPSQQTDSVQTLPQTSGETADVPSSGIRTFPGRYALPPNYFQGGQSSVSGQSPEAQSLQANMAGPESVQVSQPVTGATASPTPSPAVPQQKQATAQIPETTVKQQPVQYFSYQTPVNGSHVGEGNVQPVPVSNPTPAPVLETPSVSGSTPSVDTTDTGTGSSVTGSVPLSVTGKTPSVSTDSAAKPVQKDLLPSFVVNPTVSNMKPLEIQKVPDLNSVPTNLTLNDIAALPAQHLNLSVLYDGHFSTDERTILEKNLLPNMIGNRDIDYIQVSQLNAATILIELHYKDGDVAAFDYKVGQNGTWQLENSTVQRPAQQQ